MALVFASQKKPRAQDRASLRRQKILAGIDNQITLAGLARQGTAPKKAWFWQGEDGRYFLSIRYGRSEIELAKGMYSVECADLDALVEALKEIRGMIVNGKMDAQLQKASDTLRAKFKTE